MPAQCGLYSYKISSSPLDFVILDGSKIIVQPSLTTSLMTYLITATSTMNETPKLSSFVQVEVNVVACIVQKIILKKTE
jgi:hypothetical protein